MCDDKRNKNKNRLVVTFQSPPAFGSGLRTPFFKTMYLIGYILSSWVIYYYRGFDLPKGNSSTP